MSTGTINNGMSPGTGSGGMTTGSASTGMTPVGSSSTSVAPDLQGWHDWVENALDTSRGPGAPSFESLLAARLSPPDQQSSFLGDYQALRSKHISEYARGLAQGSTWVPGDSWHNLGCEKADRDYSAGLDQLLTKYFPTLSTDPNNVERNVVRQELINSANPASYTQTAAGDWKPDSPDGVSGNAAVRSYKGESSFE